MADTGMLTMHVVHFCAVECHLQRSGEISVWNMVQAWDWAMARTADISGPLVVEDVLMLGKMIEPEVNAWGYRTVDVRVGSSVKPPWQAVPRLMEEVLADVPQQPGDAVAEWFRQFEDVHPFRDGNGRTGALLFNWLNGTLDRPLWPPNFWDDPRRRPGFGAPAAAEADGAGITVECVDCGTSATMPYVDGERHMVHLAPLTGWTAPPTRCPSCSERPDTRSS